MYRRESVPQSGLLRTGIKERGRGMGTVGSGQRGRTLTKEQLTQAEKEALKVQAQAQSEPSFGQRVGDSILTATKMAFPPLQILGSIFGF
jgi:hypothetical protein